ncbi:hypothetical protein TNIN_222911 [Trichonephila inaurata madagascariensis]|uniref:Uncharacterized protein n=1 Tax=Trichonephila inaurata madagascariensis TaxID=2747483 RepID=A0A8X6X0M8_9ARAC|nr:hypothetical protein TNIN_222911 [Trichonephila inaurata madagascariensis]
MYVITRHISFFLTPFSNANPSIKTTTLPPLQFILIHRPSQLVPTARRYCSIQGRRNGSWRALPKLQYPLWSPFLPVVMARPVCFRFRLDIFSPLERMTIARCYKSAEWKWSIAVKILFVDGTRVPIIPRKGIKSILRDGKVVKIHDVVQVWKW